MDGWWMYETMVDNIKSKNNKHIFYFNIQRYQLGANNTNDAKRIGSIKRYICGMEKDANSAYLESMSATKKVCEHHQMWKISQ